MINYKTTKLFALLTKCASISGSIPYSWCASTKLLKISNSRSYFWFLISSTLNVLYATYLVGVITKELFLPNPDWSALPLPFGTLLISLCSLSVTLNYFDKIDNIKDIINAIFQFFQHFKEQYVPKQRLDTFRIKGLEEIMGINIFVTFFFPLVYMLYHYGNPGDRMFYFSLIPTEELRRLLFPLATLFCFYQAFSITSAMSFYFATFVPPAICILVISKEILPVNHSKRRLYMTKSSLRKPKNAIATYKALWLLTKCACSVAESLVFPLQNLLTYCVVICNICMLNFRDGLDIKGIIIVLSLAVSCLTCWSFVLWIGAMAFKISNAELATLRRHDWVGSKSDGRKWIKRTLVALRPIQLSCGGFYTVKMAKILSFTNFIVWATTKVQIFIKGELLDLLPRGILSYFKEVLKLKDYQILY
ncbi:unnamed protein product [Orchesella dallaii]|uniref:Odorant receptor n=1 Tax=Orchesella dallaii TaxID=48710 RepID=A0ABP1RMC5_9HEXA